MTSRQRDNHTRRSLLSVLYLSVLLVAALPVQAATLQVNVPKGDIDWPWKPQLDSHLPEAFFSGAVKLTAEDQWRVLSHIGAPLRIDTENSLDLLQVLELVNFMRADGQGQCPFYTTPYRVFYYRFHPAELELLYGTDRWNALQRLQEPKAWSRVLRDDVGPEVRAAEQFIAQLHNVDPPGQLTLSVRARSGEASVMHVSLSDFRVVVRVIQIGAAVVYHVPQLTVEGDAAVRRRHILHFMQVRSKMNAQIAEFDAATVEAQDDLHAALVELRNEEQAAYDRQARFKQRYQQFLLGRESHRTNDKKKRGVAAGKAAGDDREDAESALARVMTSLNVKVASRQMRTAEERRAVSCQKVYAAWATLVKNGVTGEEDGRIVQLRRLHTRHACPQPLAQLQNTASQEPSSSRPVGASLSRAASVMWRSSVVEMLTQKDMSGRSPTFGQLFAVLYGVWTTDLQKDKTASAAPPSLSKGVQSGDTVNSVSLSPSSSEFDAFRFVQFIRRFVESGDAVVAAGGWLPRFIRAELHYTLGILNLVTRNTSSSSSSSSSSSDETRGDSTVDAAVRGVLHLYESLGAGSHHAAGALATMREHGIFTRQHSKSAMLLLLRSMKNAPSHLLKELLFPPYPTSQKPTARGAQAAPSASQVGGAEKTVDAAKPDAARLLRFEQFYAVDHSFSEVDGPLTTRQSVATMVAVSNENIHSTDDAPELEDVYREAEMERTEGDFEGSITFRLSRRVVKAKMLLTGFKDTPRNPGEAQCELLVVLRRLGYFCDLDGHSVVSAERTRSADGGRRLETILGVPLTESCPEHESEVRSVLGNHQHTLLRCPARTGNAAILLAQSHPRVKVPTSEALFAMLQEVLISLSYVHLVHTGHYELSHLYATLAVEMSLRLQQLLVKNVGLLQTVHSPLSTVPFNVADAKSSSSVLPPYEALSELAEGPSEVSWAAASLAERIADADEQRSSSSADAKAKRKDKRFAEAPLSMDERAARALQRCRSVADSPFVNTEALLLLAVSRWARQPHLTCATDTTVPPVEEQVERRLSQWTLEPFQLLSSLLDFWSLANKESKAVAEDSASKGEDSATKLSSPEQSVLKDAAMEAASGVQKNAVGASRAHNLLDAHALFLVCLAAMKRWKSDFQEVHVLDSTSYSVHRTDPFVLASFLLSARDPVSGAPVIAIPQLRRAAVAATPHFLGQTPHFLPLVDDTVESYAARLLRFAGRRIHALEPSVELLRSGAYGLGSLMDGTAAASTASSRRQNALDDAPPRQSRMRPLRRVKQQTLELADLQPLLYAADAHDYFNASRWTLLGTAVSAAYNALLYPFTYTATESLLTEMEARLQLVDAEDGKRLAEMRRRLDETAKARHRSRSTSREDANSVSASAAKPDGSGSREDDRKPSTDTVAVDVESNRGINADNNEDTTSVSTFMDAFVKSIPLREHFIACQLFSFTLESGMPEGFSLMLFETTERANPFLRPLVDYLADTVFRRWVATVWTEHHLNAQWQREKTDMQLGTSLFTLNSRTPFRYASREGRQELFARLARWFAAQVNVTQGPEKVFTALDHVLWCSGLITRRAYNRFQHQHNSTQQRRHGGTRAAVVYPNGYEGAVFPAADLECVAELGRLLKQLEKENASSRFGWTTRTQLRHAQRNATALLRDLSDRLAYAYDIIELPPARRFAFSEQEFRRNVSEVEAKVNAAERQHVQRRRFERTSTQLVEPWNRRKRDVRAESLGYGEGTYYNSRLHRVSGYRWGAKMLGWWQAVRHLFPF